MSVYFASEFWTLHFYLEQPLWPGVVTVWSVGLRIPFSPCFACPSLQTPPPLPPHTRPRRLIRADAGIDGCLVARLIAPKRRNLDENSLFYSLRPILYNRCNRSSYVRDGVTWHALLASVTHDGVLNCYHKRSEKILRFPRPFFLRPFPSPPPPCFSLSWRLDALSRPAAAAAAGLTLGERKIDRQSWPLRYLFVALMYAAASGCLFYAALLLGRDLGLWARSWSCHWTPLRAQ